MGRGERGERRERERDRVTEGGRGEGKRGERETGERRESSRVGRRDERGVRE